MNFSFTLFKTALLSRWRTGLLLLLLPLTAFGARALLPPEEASAPVQVGVVLPEEGGEAFWARLEQRSGLVAVFRRTGLDRAEREVAAGRWDCALVLPEDFEDRLARLEVDGLFTLVTGPGSAVYPMVRETASACVAELVSPGMAEQYLLDSGIVEADRLEAVRPRLRDVLLDRDRVLVSMETRDGRPLNPLVLADSGVSGLLSGLTAILLLIWALLAAMDLGRWLDAPFARRLGPLSGALARLRPVWSALPAVLPFVPVLGVILSPMLLDLSLLFPALGPAVRWNPVTLYLRACGGSWSDALLLAAAGAVLLVLPPLLERKRA